MVRFTTILPVNMSSVLRLPEQDEDYHPFCEINKDYKTRFPGEKRLNTRRTKKKPGHVRLELLETPSTDETTQTE